MPARSRASRALARVRARVRRPQPFDPSGYLHGIPNRADEIVAADPIAQALMEAGILTMGDYSYYPPTVHVFAGDDARVRIGNFSSVAASSEFFVGGIHRTDWVATYGLRGVFELPGAYEDGTPMSRGDIVIGSDCWVTTGSVVLSGVTIGDGAVIGTRSVVSKDVRPYAIMAGNPAREVRRRFSDDQIDALLRIAWWNWPIEQVLEHVELLCAPDIDGFIHRFDPG